MSEYIRKEDVLNLPQSIERNLCGEIVERSIDVKDIESLEPADVVPVVRCKDCEHDISSQFDTEARCNLWGCLKPKRGFCDAGKRRDG